MQICYLIPEANVIQHLKKFYPLDDWTAYEISLNKHLNQFDAFFLLDPHKCGKEEKSENLTQLCSIFKIWKRYLEKWAPNTKLIVLGFEEITHENYLPIINIEEQNELKLLIKNAYSSEEDWENQLETNGLDVLDRLETFFKGHNQEGVFDTLAKLRILFNGAHLNHEGDYASNIFPKSFIEVWEDFIAPTRNHIRLLLSRWNNYKLFFKNLPIYEEIKKEKIEFIIVAINEFTKLKGKIEHQISSKEKQFKNLKPYNKIGKLIRVFNSISKNYVHIENEGTILLVDDDLDFKNEIKKGLPSFKIRTASTAQDAKEIIVQEDIKLVILDLNLETNEQDGLDLLEYLTKGYPELPVVIASTITQKNIIKESVRLGAKYYFTKLHFDIEKWNRVIIHILSENEFTLEDILEDISLPKLKPKILVIEDDEDWWKTIKSISAAYNFYWANSIQKAKDTIDEKKFDLIFLDLKFSEHPTPEDPVGLDLLDKIRKHGENKKTPIIISTITNENEHVVRAINLGASHYLMKRNFNLTIWKKTIDLVLNQKKN